MNKENLNELALFAGAGGGILGGKLLGWRTVCAVEWEAYPASVLCARQNDGILPPFPIWDDVQTFDGKPWRGIVDVVSGGFPCQDISVAGSGDGLDGQSSGMWREMARIIGEVRPRFAFVENSPMLVTRGLERVLADLTALGYDSKWGVISAADIGAKHQRQRIWIVAHSRHGSRRDKWPVKTGEILQGEWSAYTNQASRSGEQPPLMADSSVQRHKSQKEQICTRWDGFKHKDWWAIEPNVGRVADGVAARVDRLKAIGNGQVPLCAATAWRILSEPL
jgi:DNA (cytosine-5)-methyltransferase 1